MEKNWKIERDPFYSKLYDKFGLKYIENAGFFEDTATTNINVLDSLDILCTPVNHIKESLKHHSLSNKNCILLSTGSMCPVHSGHIEIMEIAKKGMEADGWNVLGGYISPGHDEYIFSKNKNEAIPINYRIQMINDLIKDTPWLRVDPWEGVFCKVAVNFTDVIYRLENYIEKHLGVKIPIVFVCGSDNHRFAGTFYSEGHCAVVSRPGYSTDNTIFKDGFNIYWFNGNNPNSSTEVRKSIKWKQPEKKDLQLRVANHELDNKITELLKPYFNEITLHDFGQQRLRFWDDNKGAQPGKGDVISLDNLIEGTYNLQISRNYDLFGINKLGYVRRPGTRSLEFQVMEIDKRFQYYLFDDDIHTGNTMRFAKNILTKSGVKIKGIKSMNISTPNESEILDARDFYIGFRDDGLVVELPNGKNVRVPYVYPFVDPTDRCSISNPMDFSIDVWLMNLNYWQDSKFKLSTRPHMHDLYHEYLGFPLNTPIKDICEYYYKLLIDLRNNK